MSVTLIIPVFNMEKHLAESIQSVLDGTLLPDEIVVVDDGSSDGSIAVARSFPQVKVMEASHAGPSAARNLGVANASSDLVAFLDADDLAMPRRLELQVAFLTEHPEVDVVFGDVEQFSDPPEGFPCDPRRQPAMLAGAMTVRKAVFQRVGTLNEDYMSAEFIDWCLRVQESGARIEMLPELVMRRRIHATNGGRIQRDFRQDYAKVVLAAVRRRRAKAAALAAQTEG